MTLQGIELRRIRMPLVAPFRTSFGTETTRDVLLVRAVTSDGDGWGECVAGAEPLYASEYVDGAHAVLRDHLIPRLFAAPEPRAAGVAAALAPVKGHRMAKGALELAVLDAELRAEGRSLAARLGAVRDHVASGVSIGIAPSVEELIEQVERFLSAGYARAKLKIEPGWDVEVVRRVRERFPDAALQVDANAAYGPGDVEHLARLDAFGLVLIEQPFDEEDLLSHAKLAGRIRTPVCLDESITSARAAEQAVRLGACSIVNIKAGRVGGYLEAVRVHDVCAALGVPVWCGGMLETGIGRSANVALAALPNFTLPGDVSASDRYWARDLTPPFVLRDGGLGVPAGPGLGVEPLPDVLDEVTTRTEWIAR